MYSHGSRTLFEIVFFAEAQGEAPIRFCETRTAPEGALFSDSRGMAIEVSPIDESMNRRDSSIR
jgi:hypothetical protein